MEFAAVLICQDFPVAGKYKEKKSVQQLSEQKIEIKGQIGKKIPVRLIAQKL